MSKVEHPLLQKYMQKHHQFLYNLYKEHRGWKNSETLSRATDAQIFLVLRILFCISVGHIPIRESHFQTIIRSKRRILLRQVKYVFSKLRKGPKKDIRIFVAKFASLYPVLFYPLFE